MPPVVEPLILYFYTSRLPFPLRLRLWGRLLVTLEMRGDEFATLGRFALMISGGSSVQLSSPELLAFGVVAQKHVLLSVLCSPIAVLVANLSATVRLSFLQNVLNVLMMEFKLARVTAGVMKIPLR